MIAANPAFWTPKQESASVPTRPMKNKKGKLEPAVMKDKS
jgi:hypothetical protein